MKTKTLIKTLSGAGVELRVATENSLCHYAKKADKRCMGAVSIKHGAKMVAAIGTDDIVSLCHLNQVPIHLFANLLKLSQHPSATSASIPKQLPKFIWASKTF